MTRNSNAHMRDGFVLAESDLVDFLSGSTDSAINFSGSADLHTPIHPPHEIILHCLGTRTRSVFQIMCLNLAPSQFVNNIWQVQHFALV